MKLDSFDCASCNKHCNLEGKGGGLFVRGNLLFCTLECYQKFDFVSVEIGSLCVWLRNELDTFAVKLTAMGMTSPEVQSYLGDVFYGESEAAFKQFLLRLDESRLEATIAKDS